MKSLIYILPLLLLHSCNKKKIKKDYLNNTNKVEVINSKVKKEKKNEQNIFFQNVEVDVQNIKSQIDGVTTGFLSKNEIQRFPDKMKNRYYAFYTLLKNNNKGTPSIRIGKMIVYDSINPYIYEKNTDEFVEITLTKDGVSLFDGKLQIGMTNEEVQNTFGKSDIEINDENILIYKNENKIAVFTFKNSLLIKIKMGIYKKDLDMKDIILDSY